MEELAFEGQLMLDWKMLFYKTSTYWPQFFNLLVSDQMWWGKIVLECLKRLDRLHDLRFIRKDSFNRDDEAPAYPSHFFRDWFSDNNVYWSEWPPYRHGFSSIVKLWCEIKSRLRQNFVKWERLLNVTGEIGDKLKVSENSNLHESVSQRIENTWKSKIYHKPLKSHCLLCSLLFLYICLEKIIHFISVAFLVPSVVTQSLRRLLNSWFSEKLPMSARSWN